MAAAEKLGLKKVPVLVKDDLTNSQIRQLRLADNKITESPWDEELLAVELEVLMEEVADLIVTDTPCNVNHEDNTNMLNKYQKVDHIKNVYMEAADFAEFLFESYLQMIENVKPGGCMYFFHADNEGINFRTEFKRAGFKLAQSSI